MKFLTTLAFIFFIQVNSIAQNVGINNTNPQTALDIEGRLRIRPAVLTVTGSSITIPNGNTGYHTLSGTPGTDYTVTLPAGDPGSFLLLENITPNVATITNLVKILPGKSRLLLKGNTGWILANDSESQLEKITEGSNIGWRLLGRNPANYGDIGDGAVDFTFSSLPSSTYGATGAYATAMGYFTTASGLYSTATGTNTRALGNYSTAMGFNAVANGNFSTAIGYETTALGENTFSMGTGTIAKSYTSLAIGRFNDTIAGSDVVNWVSTDPLLTIGNGMSTANRSNAITVYKNGNTDLNGFTRLGNATDAAPKIKMKEFTITSANTLTGESTPIVHGLTQAKIISATALMETAGLLIPIEYSGDLTLRYNFYITDTSIIIRNNATSGTNVFSKPVRILVTYKE